MMKTVLFWNTHYGSWIIYGVKLVSVLHQKSTLFCIMPCISGSCYEDLVICWKMTLGTFIRHQKRISNHTSRMRNKTQRAFSHSKIEAKLNNKEICASTSAVELDAKRTFKKQKTDTSARWKDAKLERENNRMTSLQTIEQKQHIKMVSFYDDEKGRILSSTANEDFFFVFFSRLPEPSQGSNYRFSPLFYITIKLNLN